MTQQELLTAVSEIADVGQAQVSAVLHAFGDVLAEALEVGDSVTHAAIGKFVPADHAARSGRHPQTGEAIQIAASRTVRYRPSKALRGALNPQRKRA